MKTLDNDQVRDIWLKLSQISESAKLGKGWLEIISKAKIAESDRETCKNLSIQLDIAERNAEDIKKSISN